MKKNNGFTLIELLVTFILLAVVGGIIIFNVSSNDKSQKEKEYEKYVDLVESAANVYAGLNKGLLSDLEIDNKNISISIGDLIEAGLLNADTKNPYTNENISPDDVIYVGLDEVSGLVKYEFDDKTSEYIGLTQEEIESKEEEKKKNIADINLSIADINSPLNTLTKSTGTDINSYFKEMKDYGNYKLKLYSNNEFINNYADYQLKVDSIKPHDIDGVGEYTITYSWINNLGLRKTAKRKVSITPSVCKLDISAKNVYVNGTLYPSYSKKIDVIDGTRIEQNYPDFKLTGYNYLGLILNANNNQKVYVSKEKLNSVKFTCNGDNAVVVCENNICDTVPSNKCENGQPCTINELVVSQKLINLTFILANPLRINGTTTYSTKIYYNQSSETVNIINGDTGHYYFNGYNCGPDITLSGWVNYNTTTPGSSETVVANFNKTNGSDSDITCNINSHERYVAKTTCTRKETKYECHEESVNAQWTSKHCHGHYGQACDTCWSCSYCGRCTIDLFSDHSAHLKSHNKTVCANVVKNVNYACCPSGTVDNGAGACKYV